MSRICLIGIVAALSACHGGGRRNMPDVSHPIDGTGERAPSAHVDGPPPRSFEQPHEGLGARHTADPAKTEREATKDVTVVVVEVNSRLRDAFFDYDRSAMRADAIAALRQDAALLLPILADFPQLKVTVEGHCDERGSAEYNLGLGDHRAGAAVEVLHGFGVPLAHMETISYGKERPQCTELKESCWRLNRRAHLVVRPPGVTD